MFENQLIKNLAQLLELRYIFCHTNCNLYPVHDNTFVMIGIQVEIT
jgi:hypothetical protein